MSWATAPTFVPGPLASADLNKLSGDLNAIGGAWTTDGRSAATIWSGTVGTGGSVTAAYRQVGAGSGAGGVVDWEVLITLGTGFTIGTGLTLPVTAASSTGVTSGTCYVMDASASSFAQLAVMPSTTTAVLLRTVSGSAYVTINSTTPITFAASDQLYARITYRI